VEQIYIRVQHASIIIIIIPNWWASF